jgi:hypothetical protein
MPSITSRAKYQARHAARDTGLTYAEARQRALESIPDLDAHQRCIFLTIWHRSYNVRVTRREVQAAWEALLAAGLWEQFR